MEGELHPTTVRTACEAEFSSILMTASNSLTCGGGGSTGSRGGAAAAAAAAAVAAPAAARDYKKPSRRHPLPFAILVSTLLFGRRSQRQYVLVVSTLSTRLF